MFLVVEANITHSPKRDTSLTALHNVQMIDIIQQTGAASLITTSVCLSDFVHTCGGPHRKQVSFEHNSFQEMSFHTALFALVFRQVLLFAAFAHECHSTSLILCVFFLHSHNLAVY